MNVKHPRRIDRNAIIIIIIIIIVVVVLVVVVVVVVVAVVVLVLALSMCPSQYFRSNPPKSWWTRKPSKSNSGVRYKPRAVTTAGCTLTRWDYLNLFTIAVRPHFTRNHGPFHLLEPVLASVSCLLNFGALKMNSDLRYTTPNCRYITSYFWLLPLHFLFLAWFITSL